MDKDNQPVNSIDEKDQVGKITARKLAEMGATVLVHGRSREKCEATVEAIRVSTGSEKPEYYVGDLSSLSAVRRLAQEIMSDHPRLDVLINNAGVGPGKGSDRHRRLSRDGTSDAIVQDFKWPL